MSKYYGDYFWKEGIPLGIRASSVPLEGVSYKIPSDPYHKQISIEKYQDGRFSEVVYDSALFNFRHLTPAHQARWEKIHDQTRSEIRDQDDRLILIEEYLFEQNLCRTCRSCSPHGILISTQKIFYTLLNDPFNGLILYDSNAHPVMSKRYEWDAGLQQFSTLLEVQCNFQR
jgi:hypothetical protein